MVSIIIPTFNRQDYVGETLNSVLRQTYEDWECIVVDDGSLDDTEKAVHQFVQSDARFSFYKRPAEMLKGANSCRNYGFSVSKGTYIKFLDSDDIITEDCLQKQKDILDANPEKKVCMSYGQFFNNDTKQLEEFWSRNKEYNDYLLGHVTNQIRWAISDPLWRKSFFTEVPFKEGLMNSQEWLMHGQAVLKLKKDEIYNLKETFTLIRRGNERMSSSKSSSYYKNQKLARVFLLKDLWSKNIFKWSYNYELFKQIVVYYYWQVKEDDK